MYKMAWIDKKVVKKDVSTTATFLRCMVKIFLVPLTVDKQKNEVRFNVWSKPFMFHVILYWVPFLAIGAYAWYLVEKSGFLASLATRYTPIEEHTAFMTYLQQITMILPALTCYKFGRSKLRAALFCGSTRFPRHTWYNIASICFQFSGSLAHIYALHSWYNFPDGIFLIVFLLYGFGCFIIAIFWSLSAFLVEVSMENLGIEEVKNNFILRSNKTLENYQKISQSLGCVFLIFFSVIQVSSIVNLFLSISKFIIKVKLCHLLK